MRYDYVVDENSDRPTAKVVDTATHNSTVAVIYVGVFINMQAASYAAEQLANVLNSLDKHRIIGP